MTSCTTCRHFKRQSIQGWDDQKHDGFGCTIATPNLSSHYKGRWIRGYKWCRGKDGTPTCHRLDNYTIWAWHRWKRRHD